MTDFKSITIGRILFPITLFAPYVIVFARDVKGGLEL
ncbi:MAG: hypothetical protein DIAAKJNI_00225 [Candidatus Argoarchaeum ethanivorans]|uniref:Uncharacterized protein n=1 Tax=Candidatus Argoarchaeum ethanivorans TaxID=2608793 RepID=A0A811T926_9EURY|nr:MAG: hypothetical protein DIAAKJNI_00225 [Candidatus Argoarchaeum ethanivorans]